MVWPTGGGADAPTTPLIGASRPISVSFNIFEILMDFKDFFSFCKPQSGLVNKDTPNKQMQPTMQAKFIIIDLKFTPKIGIKVVESLL